ncbi:MAG TPA: hypothetical protein H9751_09795 [Candidatus Corynebacterium faecigallinarum]|uniref:Uncharacterized protein n=1 Tax=Candidatus Corynebacterium faecigallinarum TaxID=2838528 RepID=A0A9D2QHT8_9CORY|nr:hypothetical protein [Candidatus Corynebacterium faecigallinarum]
MSTNTSHTAPIIVDHSLDIDTPTTNARLVNLANQTITDLLNVAHLDYNGEPDGYQAQSNMYADAAAHAHDLYIALDRLSTEAHEASMDTTA